MFKSNIVLFWLSNKGNNLQAWSAQTVISYKQTLSSLTLVNNTLILISVRCFVSEAQRQKPEHHFWFNILETNTHIILGKTSLIHGAGWTENSYIKHKAALVCFLQFYHAVLSAACMCVNANLFKNWAAVTAQSQHMYAMVGQLSQSCHHTLSVFTSKPRIHWSLFYIQLKFKCEWLIEEDWEVVEEDAPGPEGIYGRVDQR